MFNSVQYLRDAADFEVKRLRGSEDNVNTVALRAAAKDLEDAYRYISTTVLHGADPVVAKAHKTVAQLDALKRVS